MTTKFDPISTRCVGNDSNSDAHEIAMGFLDEDVAFQVHQTRRALRQSLRRRRGKMPPSGTITSLLLIGMNPGISQKEIAEAQFLDASKVALLVRELEREGRAEKRRSATDGRRLELFLTPQGQALFDDVVTWRATREKALAKHLTTDEREQLVNLLRKLQRAVSAPD